METFPIPEKKFGTPQEELAYLREEIARKEQELKASQNAEALPTVASETVKSYKETPQEHVLAEPLAMTAHEQEAVVLDLSPESHDKQMEELIGFLQEKGIKNVLSLVEKMGNPHLEDDFHRILVQYLKAGLPVKGLKEKSELGRELRMTLYEVTLPETVKAEEGIKKTLKELISSMEQFYQGMSSITEGSPNNYFTIELALPNVGEAVSFYVSVPDRKKELFEKQISAIFPNVALREQKDDYNIFNPEGSTVASYGAFEKRGIYSLKLYEEFDYDPLNVLLNAFSKLSREGEGAAIQFVIQPERGKHLRAYQKALRDIQKGYSLSRATNIHFGFPGGIYDEFRDFFREKPKKRHGEAPGARPEDKQRIENIEKKTGSPIVLTNIRLAVSSGSESSALATLGQLEAPFNQFKDTNGNGLRFERVKRGALRRFLKEFSFRAFSPERSIPLSTKELTTVVHFPPQGIKSSPEFKQSKAGSAPAPLDLPQEGTLMGINSFRNKESKVYITDEDRLRHLYVIGQTGTGKSSFLKSLVIQDIEKGNGVCMIDPHGVDILDILANIPPERYGDLIYFDPGNTSRPMGLNMLEYDPKYPEMKTFVVNEMFSIFQKLYGKVPESMGPMFEQYFRNATMLVIEDPESGSTLLDVSRVLADASFRELKLSRCKNPIVSQFWREIAEKTGGEHALANMVPWITSKFDVFLANDIMRPIVAQQNSAFNFREIMDEKKILLVNLAKGRLGDINSNLLGLIIVGKFLMAALSRVDSVGKAFPPFYLYIDEFQNTTTPSIATILSEARKYKLSLTVAHQFIKQLSEEIKDAVFGNVGSMAVFRVGAEDAEALKSHFEPVFTPSDIMNLDNYNAYLRLLIKGQPAKPFNVKTIPPPRGDSGAIDKLKELSYLTYGRPREEVEEEIMARYQGVM